jgi:hypothetical protein
MILDSSVERARVCGWRVVWQGATTRMAAPCKEAQRGQTTRQSCNRARSGLTLRVRFTEGCKASVHEAFQWLMSGQLRNQG